MIELGSDQEMRPEELQFDGDMSSPVSLTTTDPTNDGEGIRSPSAQQLRSTIDWEELPVTFDLGNISISRSNLTTPQPAHKTVKWERPPESDSMESLNDTTDYLPPQSQPVDNRSQSPAAPESSFSGQTSSAQQTRSPSPSLPATSLLRGSAGVAGAIPAGSSLPLKQSRPANIYPPPPQAIVNGADLDLLNQKNLDLVHRLHSAHQLLAESDRLVRQSQEEIQSLRDGFKRSQMELVQSNQQRSELLEENDQIRNRLQFLEDRLRLGEQDLRLARIDSLKVEALENELALLKQSREKILTERNEYYTKWQEYLHHFENVETENKLLSSQYARIKDSNGLLMKQIEEYKDDLQKAMKEMQVRDRMIRDKVAFIRKLESDRDHADALETAELRSRIRSLEDEQGRQALERISPSPTRGYDSQTATESEYSPTSSPRARVSTAPTYQSASQSPRQQSRQGSPVRPRTAGPVFSAGSISDLIRQTEDSQDRLAELSAEKEQLEAEYARFPLAGGSMSMRKRRLLVESRLDAVSREIGAVKLQLKSLHAL